MSTGLTQAAAAPCASEPPTNLPIIHDALIGRERDLATAHDLLSRPSVRLLTLTGTGGSGKTRLAIRLAADARPGFADGVFMIALAALRDPALLAATTLRVLGLSDVAGRLPAEVLADHLRERRLLLVLDNFEHLLEAAPLVLALLEAAPRLVVLITSRAPLGLPDEHELPVLPLALPELERLMDLERLSASAAVALFIRRVGEVRPDFRLSAENARAVAEICVRLDGLPLAIELAAARGRLLAPREILARLEHRLPLLSAGPPDAPMRQRTLRDTIAWSYDLLDEVAQGLFRRLSVFVGGWTVDAAEAVSGVDGQTDVSVLDALTSLVLHSLVQQADGPDGTSRFRMLETVREYAGELLAASGEESDTRNRHLAWGAAFADLAGQFMRGPDQAIWHDRLQVEHDNLRAALHWATAVGDGAGLGLHLASALGRNFWALRGYHREGRAWLSHLLVSAPARSTSRAIGLDAIGNLAQRQNDYPAAQVVLAEAIEIFRALGDRPRLATALRRLGVVPHHLGQFDEAQAMLQESVALWREIGDGANLTVALHNLGDLAYDRGDYDRAVAIYEECITLGDSHQDRHAVAYALRGLGHVARAQGQYPQAMVRFRESLRLLKPLQDRRCIPLCLEGLACVTVEDGWADRAARLLGATEAMQARTGAPSPPSARADYQRTVVDARQRLGDVQFEAAWAAGAGMGLIEAVDLALTEDPPTGQFEKSHPHDATRTAAGRQTTPLTRRECEVVGLIAQGLSNRQIAERLTLSLRTVERHIENVYNRLGCTGKAGRAIVTAYAIRHGLTETA